MTFEQALTAMKEGKSVRRSFHRYDGTRFALCHTFTEYVCGRIAQPDRIFLREELLAEDWEIVPNINPLVIQSEKQEGNQ